MQKTFGTHGMSVAVLILIFLGFSSCINEKYNMENLNTEVTVAQQGLSLPLGTTEKLKVSDLVKDLNQNLLNQINGAFAIKFGDTLDLSKNLPNMNELLKINDISFNDSFTYDVDNLNPDGMVVNASEFNTKFDAASGLVTDMKIPEVTSNEKIALGLHEYVAKLRDIDLSSSLTNQVFDAKAAFTLPTIPPAVSGEFPIVDVTQSVSSQACKMNINIKCSDDNITNVCDIKLDDNSKINIKVELQGHEFITKGDVVPNINLECGKLFGMKDALGAPMSSPIVLSKPLNHANNFTSTEVISFTSLNVKESDLVNGILNISYPMSINGTVSLKNAATSSAALNSYTGNGEIRVAVTISFSDVKIKSATFDLKEIVLNKSIQVPVSLGSGVTYPEQISSIDDVVFTQDSKMDMSLMPENFNIPNLNAIVNSMTIQFPSAMKVGGAIGGTISLGEFNLKNGLNEAFGVERIDFPASKTPGMLTWDDVININTQITLSGKRINSENIPSTTTTDAAMRTDVYTALAIQDWHATIKTFEKQLDPVTEKISQDLSGQISDFGTFMVTPAGNPDISISVDMPSAALQPIAGNDGLKLEFPKFIKFKNVNPSYNFNSNENSITFKQDIPQNIVMNIDKLVITPEPKVDGTGNVLNGEFKISGSIKFNSGQVSGSDVDGLKINGIKVIASIPQMKPEKVELSEFKVDINENFTTTLLKGSDLPAEIVSISESSLDNVNINLGLNLSGLPNIGAGKELMADLKITLPEEIVLDQNDSRVQGNVLNINTPVKNNVISIDPIKVTGIDLSKYDFSTKEDINRTISIAGKLSVSQPSIDLSQILQPIKADITAKIANIKFSKISGKIDYAIQPTEQNVALKDIPDFLKNDKVCLDIANPYLIIKAKTNLGIPMNGTLSVLPVRKGVTNEEDIINLTLSLKGSHSAAEKDSTMYFIAAKDEGCPADYTFIECTKIKDLIKSIPDELKLSFTANTSTTDDCIVEPNAKYTFDVDYSLVAPMAFGEELNIELTDTLTGLGDIFPKLIKDNKIQLAGDITNALPLELNLEVKLIDKNDQTLKLANPATLQIKSCASDGSANIVPLNLLLDVDPTTDLSDFKGLLFTFKVTSGNAVGIPVTEESFVQAKVLVKLPEGASFDIKDFNKVNTQNKNSNKGK